MKYVLRGVAVFLLTLFVAIPAAGTCELCELEGERGVCKTEVTPSPGEDTFSNCQGGATCAYIPTPFGVIRFCWPACSGDLCLWV